MAVEFIFTRGFAWFVRFFHTVNGGLPYYKLLNLLFLQRIEFFCVQILSTVARLFMRSFRFSPPRGRRSKLLVAREKKPLPKDAEVFCRRAAVSTAVLTTILCARWAPNMRFLKGWRTAISFLCLSVWLVSIFCLRYRHKNKEMTRKIMFYPVRIQKQRELVYCRPT